MHSKGLTWPAARRRCPARPLASSRPSPQPTCRVEGKFCVFLNSNVFTGSPESLNALQVTPFRNDDWIAWCSNLNTRINVIVDFQMIKKILCKSGDVGAYEKCIYERNLGIDV